MDKVQIGAQRQILGGLRGKNVIRPRFAHNAGGYVHGHAAQILPANFAFTGMHANAALQPQLCNITSDGPGTFKRAGRAAE